MSLTVLTLLAIIAKQLVGVFAQNVTTTATQCQLPSLPHLYNSLGQSPCLIAAWLQAPCFNWNFEVPGSDPGLGAYGPAGDGTDECTCSTVTYSMIAACGLCQGDSAGNWSIWSANCSDPYIQIYNMPIPNETAVQDWAYLAMLDDTFDVSAAMNNAGPESSASVSPTTATATTTAIDTATVTSISISTTFIPPSTTSTSSTASSSSTLSFSSSEDASQKSSHVGAIAGGTVGGFVALGVIGSIVAVFLSRQRRNQWAASSGYDVHNTQSPPIPPMTQENYHAADGVGVQAPLTQAPLTHYDPSDHNIYPTSSTPVTGRTSSSPGVQSGFYNYAPEI